MIRPVVPLVALLPWFALNLTYQSEVRLQLLAVKGKTIASPERDLSLGDLAGATVGGAHGAVAQIFQSRPTRLLASGEALGGPMDSPADAVASAPERERLVDQAYRRIRDAIVALDLRPGAPLDEKALSASLGLGLTPIRDALKRLTLEKLAVTYPGRGTFASRINIADEARLTEIRVELEGLAAALAAERATEDERAALVSVLDDLEHGSHERVGHTGLDAQVHRAIYSAAGNEFLEARLNQYANLALRIWNFCLQGEPAGEQHIHSQRAVVEAIVRRDSTGARAAAQQHLKEFSEDVRSTINAARG
jgi:DNA-binding GntR family transcriptional regulator